MLEKRVFLEVGYSSEQPLFTLNLSPNVLLQRENPELTVQIEIFREIHIQVYMYILKRI